MGTLDGLYRYEMDDVSKVTLPAWPGQGNGRHLVIFRTLSPFVFLSVLGCYFVFRCYLDLCIVSFCILARWSRCCIYMFFCGSVVNCRDVTTCNDSTRIACMFRRARGAWGAPWDRYYADFGGNAKTA